MLNMSLFTPSDNPKPGSFFKSNSFSGGERNRLFLRRDGNYRELTLASGADFREDSRGFLLFDYDNDGWLDIGLTSPNAPRFRVIRNEMGDSDENQNSFVELVLVGGQTTAQPSTEWSPRDPFGATVLVTTGDEKRIFQLSCGEGLSHQNAKRIHIGMGDRAEIDSLSIQWPSGKTTVMENIAAGKRLTIFENPESNK